MYFRIGLFFNFVLFAVLSSDYTLASEHTHKRSLDDRGEVDRPVKRMRYDYRGDDLTSQGIEIIDIHDVLIDLPQPVETPSYKREDSHLPVTPLYPDRVILAGLRFVEDFFDNSSGRLTDQQVEIILTETIDHQDLPPRLKDWATIRFAELRLQDRTFVPTKDLAVNYLIQGIDNANLTPNQRKWAAVLLAETCVLGWTQVTTDEEVEKFLLSTRGDGDLMPAQEEYAAVLLCDLHLQKRAHTISQEEVSTILSNIRRYEAFYPRARIRADILDVFYVLSFCVQLRETVTNKLGKRLLEARKSPYANRQQQGLATILLAELRLQGETKIITVEAIGEMLKEAKKNSDLTPAQEVWMDVLLSIMTINKRTEIFTRDQALKTLNDPKVKHLPTQRLKQLAGFTLAEQRVYGRTKIITPQRALGIVNNAKKAPYFTPTQKVWADVLHVNLYVQGYANDITDKEAAHLIFQATTSEHLTSIQKEYATLLGAILRGSLMHPYVGEHDPVDD